MLIEAGGGDREDADLEIRMSLSMDASWTLVQLILRVRTADAEMAGVSGADCRDDPAVQGVRQVRRECVDQRR